jgi:FG-GAP-like repeat
VTPYGADFTGGVRTALADVNADGTADLITAPGAGTAPTVKVYDGKTHEPLNEFDAYESAFQGGVNLAAGDFDADGRAEVVTGADWRGGPRVRVFAGTAVLTDAPPSVQDFMAMEDARFRGGVRVAVGDYTGDGRPDLLVGAGKGGGPRVTGFDGKALGEGTLQRAFGDFFSHDPATRDGTVVRIDDLTGDGVADLVFTDADGRNGRFVNGAVLQNQARPDEGIPVYHYYVSNPGTYYPHGKAGDYKELIPYIGGPDYPAVPVVTGPSLATME